MYRIIESAIIERPVSEVFAIAADPDKQLAWDTGGLRRVDKLTPGPLERGARYRGDFKGFGIVEYEFVEYELDLRFAHRRPDANGRDAPPFHLRVSSRGHPADSGRHLDAQPGGPNHVAADDEAD